jgi:isopenicillin-N epimerase
MPTNPTSQSACQPPEPLISDPGRLWLLDPELDFLNHGSFGAVPREVLDAQTTWREAIERDPIEMMGRRIFELLEPSRWAAGELINCHPDSVGFSLNATSAINAVVRSLSFKPGDRIVAPNHVYNGVRQTLRWVAARDGAEYVEIPVELPVENGDQLGDRILDSIPQGTRLLVIDEISSPTAIRFPIERIIRECSSRGIQVVVDGAHAPGMVEVDVTRLESLGMLAWTGNLHKWAYVPKSCAALFVHEESRDNIHPAIISHFLDDGFKREFEWQGTIDFTPWLTVPAALSFMETTFGIERLLQHNHQLATWAHAHLCSTWDVEPLTPLDGSLLGAMAAMALPRKIQEHFENPMVLQHTLYDNHRIETPVHAWGDDWLIRVSAQAYNRTDQYQRLGEVILELADRGPREEPRIRVTPL